jgi:hypothetical protein
VSVDRRHQVNSYGTWDLPFGSGKLLLNGGPSWFQRAVEGWQLSGTLGWSSGAPLGFTTSRNTAGGGTNTADIVGSLPDDFGKVFVGDGFVTYFEGLAAKTAPPPDFGGNTTLPGRFTNQAVVDQSGNIVARNPLPGTTGNASARFFTGPSNIDFNLALSKRVRIGEGKTFTLRADAVDVLNKPKWGNPNVDINSANFGRITSATGARTITFNARVDF